MTKKKTTISSMTIAPIEMPVPTDIFGELDKATAAAERPSAKIEPMPDRDILAGLFTSACVVATMLAIAVKLWMWALS